MTEKDKRLLNTPAPGVISSLVQGAFLCSISAYSAWTWRKLGTIGFAKPAVIVPLGGMVAGWIGTNWVMNELREWQFGPARSRMVSRYSDQWGEKFLLDVL